MFDVSKKAPVDKHVRTLISKWWRMRISKRLLEMSQELWMAREEVVYQEREMACLSGWFADTLLAYSASSSGGHHTCFLLSSVFFFSFVACVLMVYQRIGFLWYIISPLKDYCTNTEHKHIRETNVLNVLHCACVRNFEVRFALVVLLIFWESRTSARNKSHNKVLQWEN